MTCFSSLRAAISLPYGLLDVLDDDRLCLRLNAPARLSADAEVDAEEVEDAEETEMLLELECCRRVLMDNGARLDSHFSLS